MSAKRPDPVFVVDIIGDAVTATNTVIIEQLKAANVNIQAINYMFGPPLEINEILASMSQSQQFKKYPLVALYQPFDEGKGDLTGIDGKNRLRIIIAMPSLATDIAKDRYTKNFRPILYPLYAELMYQLSVSKAIAATTWEKIPHKKRDWPYWDNDGKNPLIDFVDIIEISNLELNFRYKNC